MKVTVYGDSILKGVLLEGGKYVVNHAMEEEIGRRCGLDIRNRSRFGCTIRRAMNWIRKDSADGASGKEYAVLEFGGNDCDYDWPSIAADPDGTFDCHTPPKGFENDYREAIGLIRAGGRIPVVMTLPPVDAERYLGFICRDGLPRENILHWLGDVGAIARWQEKYSELVTRIAKEEKTVLIDLRSAFLNDGGGLRDLLCADGIHPSRAGQELICRTVCGSMA